MFRKPVELIMNVEKIMNIHYYELSKDYYYSGESHDFWEMVYVDKGEFVATADEREIVVHQGQAIFHKPNEFHRVASNNVIAPNIFIITFCCNSQAMHFFEKKVIDVPNKLRKNITMIIEEAQQALLLPLFNPYINKLDADHTPPAGAIQMIKLYLEQFLISLYRCASTKTNEQIPSMYQDFDDYLVQEMIGYLNKHLLHSISIAALCQEFSYSKAYLSKLFKSKTGRTILEYFTALKIAEAKRLIRETNLNISQIASQLSYESSQYFSRSFKRVTGMTPQEYRQSVLND